jgi:hypothetical protein
MADTSSTIAPGVDVDTMKRLGQLAAFRRACIGPSFSVQDQLLEPDSSRETYFSGSSSKAALQPGEQK